jgi:hypothetical protein
MWEMIQQLFGSIGDVVKVYTLVDFYNYVKAVEYLICAAFFAIFPLFYKYIIKTPSEREADSFSTASE